MLGVLFNTGKFFMGMRKADSNDAVLVIRKRSRDGKPVETAQIVTLDELYCLKTVIEQTIFDMEYEADNAGSDKTRD